MKIKSLHRSLCVTLFSALVCLCATERVAAQNIINTICGTGSASSSGDGGSPLAATINQDVMLTVDAIGNIYIGDFGGARIRKMTLATGIISTYAGTGSAGFSGDGGPATSAQINGPSGVWADAAGNVYIADVNNYRVRKVDPSGTITTIAGTGSAGYSGDGGPATAATFQGPGRVHVDAGGNIYISDRNNYCIRKINTSGIISTFAGNGSSGFSGDGGAATSAQMNVPFCIESDASGNVYVADLYNNRVRMINSSGIISTIAGTGSSTFSGDGGAATAAGVDGPEGLAWDAAGNFYIGDNTSTSLGDDRIRIVSTSGIINTFAGTGGTGFTGDGGPATAATFYIPGGLARHRNGVYVADQFNNRVRRIGLSNMVPIFSSGATATLTVCQNASATSIVTQLAVTDSDEFQPLTWSTYTGPSHGSLGGFSFTWLSNGATVTPSGLTYTPTTGYTGTDAFQVLVFDGWGTYDTITVNVTISPAPSAGTISGPTTVCTGTTITLSSTVSGGTWSSSNVSQATISSSGVVSGLVVGSPTISYSVTNSCGTAYGTYAITVLPQPVSGTISGATAVCVGQSITLSSTGTGGSWSATNSNATVTASGTVTGAVAGLDTIQYSVTNSCGTAVASYVITVNPLPGAITGTTTLCDGGNTVVLSTTSTTGSWSTSTSSVASVNSSGTVTSTGPGAATISYTLPATGCYVTTTVTVNPLPAAITGGNNICLGSAIALSTTSTGGNWSSSNTSVASVSTTGSVTGTGLGAATITYTNPLTGCYVTHGVTVTAVPPAITGTTFICVGVSSVMSNTSAGGTWSTSNSAIASITTTTTSTGTMTGVTVGSATITYTNGGCYSTLAVTVGSSPGPITGPTAVCEGATVTVSNASTGGTWTTSNTATATITSGGVVGGGTAGTVTISYSLGSGCTSTAAFTVNPVPAAITGTTVVCAGGATTTLSDATSGGAWSTANAAIASVNAGTGTVTGVASGTVTISYTRLGCYNTATVTVNPQATAVVTPIGDTTMCPGDFVVLTGPTFSSYSYQWYNGATAIAGETGSYYVAYGAGNYRLGIVNSYGCFSSSAPMAVTVNPVTVAATVAGSTTICGGTTVNISATTGAGLTYQWTLGGIGISGATGSVYAAGTSGSYNVIATNAAGCSAASAGVYVTVLPAPTNTLTIGGPLSFCDGGSVLLTAGSGSGLTYQWQIGGVNITGATNMTYAATTTGNYQVVVTNGYPCSSTSAVAAVNVIALPSANITVSGSPTFCGGGSVPMATVAATGNTYQWSYNGTPITGATTVNYTAATGGNYAVTVTAPTGCIKTTTPAQVLTEMTTPYITPITSVVHCWGGTSILSAHTSTTVGISYQWQFNGTNIAGATNSTYNANPSGYYSCVISLAAGGCSSSSPWVAVTEVMVPNPVITYDGAHLKTDTGFAIYQWYRNYTAIPGATAYAYAPTATGYYAVQVTTAYGCRSFSPEYVLKSLVLDTTHSDTTHHGGSGGGTTAVKAISKDDIKIFPNPAQSAVHIIAAVPLRAVITTVDGRKVIDETNAQTINLSQLASGMYMLMLFDENGQMVKNEKLVKE